MLIELHLLSGDPIYVNPDHICWLNPQMGNRALQIRFVDGSEFVVEETAEEFYHLRTTAAGHKRLKRPHDLSI